MAPRSPDLAAAMSGPARHGPSPPRSSGAGVVVPIPVVLVERVRQRDIAHGRGDRQPAVCKGGRLAPWPAERARRGAVRRLVHELFGPRGRRARRALERGRILCQGGDALLAHVDVDGVVDEGGVQAGTRRGLADHVERGGRVLGVGEGQVRHDGRDVVPVVSLNVFPPLRRLLHERGRRPGGRARDGRHNLARLLRRDELPHAVRRHDQELVAVARLRRRLQREVLDVRVGDDAVLFALPVADGARHGEADLAVGPDAGRPGADGSRDGPPRRQDASCLGGRVWLAVLGQVVSHNLAVEGRAHHGARVARAGRPEGGAVQVNDDGCAATCAGEPAVVAGHHILLGVQDRRGEHSHRVGPELDPTLLQHGRDLLDAHLGHLLARDAVPVEDAEQGLVVRIVEWPKDGAAVLVDLGVGRAAGARHYAVAGVASQRVGHRAQLDGSLPLHQELGPRALPRRTKLLRRVGDGEAPGWRAGVGALAVRRRPDGRRLLLHLAR
mmetsp:Transcript_9917/g.32792  ORF Transcript_9917/g.32792 Transcript_9917/m.32792 type:complete len:498 (-) Transcript_9917:79-1572(-)